MPKNEMSYETAITRLKEVVDRLGEGGVSLEEAVSLYEEGVELLKFCRSVLGKARKRIDVLKRDLEGNIVLEEIEDEDIKRIVEEGNNPTSDDEDDEEQLF